MARYERFLDERFDLRGFRLCFAGARSTGLAGLLREVQPGYGFPILAIIVLHPEKLRAILFAKVDAS